MNINYKESQFQLFPAHPENWDDTIKPKFFLATMTLSIENLVILFILGIMIGLFSFSLGVERGRHLVAQALDEKVAAAWNVGGRRLATVTNVPQAVIVDNNPITKASVVRHGGTVKSVAKVVGRQSVVTASTPAIGNRWTVQIATYKNENFAQKAALGIKTQGYPVFIIKNKEHFLVCIGQYGVPSQAEAYLRKIQSGFKGSQIRRF